MSSTKVAAVLEGPIAFVDIETDGSNYLRGHVIEVAAIRVENGAVTREFRSLIQPGLEVPSFITRLTGITNHDLADAPTFSDIADELFDVLDGCLFVAHNVRFDYSFLKQEFKRLGMLFDPKQLCTVRLSRALYPEQKSHKLSELIRVHGLRVSARHRAYDDASALLQFMQLLQDRFSSETIHEAVSRQLKHPSLPKHLERTVIDQLPTGHGVYTFEDEQGAPLYIGKSIHVKKRVLNHFTQDTKEYREFKMAQAVHGISTITTDSELESLLLESQLIKEKQPVYNRKLRRVSKLVVAIGSQNTEGYIEVGLKELGDVRPEHFDTILATYTRRSMAKQSIENAVKVFSLCPKLAGLEKASHGCFSYQLHKCKGACVGSELPDTYNARVATAFERSRIEAWPHNGPVLIAPRVNDTDSRVSAFIVDQWRIIGRVVQDPHCEVVYQPYKALFDLDSYKILKAFMASKKDMIVTPLSSKAKVEFGIAP